MVGWLRVAYVCCLNTSTRAFLLFLVAMLLSAPPVKPLESVHSGVVGWLLVSLEFLVAVLPSVIPVKPLEYVQLGVVGWLLVSLACLVAMLPSAPPVKPLDVPFTLVLMGLRTLHLRSTNFFDDVCFCPVVPTSPRT